MRLWLIIGAVVAILGMVAATAAYVGNNERVKRELQERITVYEANERTYKEAIQNQADAINFLQQSQAKIRSEYERATAEFAKIEEERRILSERIQDMELSKSAAENPSAVEIIINKQSSESKRCLELATGAPLNNDERNAKNAEEFNSVCPQFFVDP